MYEAVGTRLDITFATTYFAQFASNPGPEHSTTVKRVLKYIKGTIDFHLTNQRSSQATIRVIGYADASYASNTAERHSFSGQCLLINNCLVSWKTKKQSLVATSTTEAEYMLLSEAARQMGWMRQAIKDLRIKTTFELKGDNTGSIAVANNPVFHTRSKHIDVHFHYVREKLAETLFSLDNVPTGDNYADLFTKGLGQVKYPCFLQIYTVTRQGEC